MIRDYRELGFGTLLNFDSVFRFKIGDKVKVEIEGVFYATILQRRVEECHGGIQYFYGIYMDGGLRQIPEFAVSELKEGD